MDQYLMADFVNLGIRWFHVIAAITWIGHAFFFNWLDAHLSHPAAGEKQGVEGELWMVHSGGYYQVEKRTALPAVAPKVLHWFKWEAFLTWLSGFTLLSWVYYMNDGALLIDTSVRDISANTGIAIGIGTLVIGWIVYDQIWLSPLGQMGPPTILLCLGLLVGVAFGLTHVFSSRAAYIHVGALIGTIMVANVWFRIIPAQQHMLATAKSGGELNLELGKRAKGRSRHNNYLGYPVVAIMLSNHVPIVFGHKYNWLFLAGVLTVGATIRYIMNSMHHAD